MQDRDCQDIVERLAKLEQKTADLEDFVKDLLVNKIDELETKVGKKLGNTKEIVEKRFKWMLELFVMFFISIVIPLIGLIIMVARG